METKNNKVIEINEETENKELNKTAEQSAKSVEPSYKKITLQHPITFEGKEYKEIDLSKLEELTGKDMKKISRIYRSLGGAAMTKELDIEYLQIVASYVTDLPIEFFDELKAKDSTSMEVVIRNFLIL